MTEKASSPWVTRTLHFPPGSIDLGLLAKIEGLLMADLKEGEELQARSIIEANDGSMSHDSWAPMVNAAADAELVPMKARGSISVVYFDNSESPFVPREQTRLKVEFSWSRSWTRPFRELSIGSRDIERLNAARATIRRTIRQHHRSKEDSAILTRVRHGPLYRQRLWWTRQSGTVQVGLGLVASLLFTAGMTAIALAT